MNRAIAVTTCLLSSLSFAGPEVQIDCPAGTHFVTGKGCLANIAAKVECPGGTRYDGKKCVAVVDTSCPAGMHFVAGTGCVAGKAAAVEAPPPPPERPDEPAKKKKGGTFSSGFSDRLGATCAGLDIEVHGGTRLTGVRAMLLVDGRKVGDEQDVNVGQTKSISGKQGKKAVDLTIQQGLWGTRYTLKVDGVECKLTK